MADFTNSSRGLAVGFGSGLRFNKSDVVISNTASTVDTTSIAPSPGVRSGYFRFRTKTVDASATTVIKLTLGDGSTTVTVINTTAATAAGEAVDYLFPFCVDIAATVFTLTITVGGTTKTLTYDVEVTCSAN